MKFEIGSFSLGFKCDVLCLKDIGLLRLNPHLCLKVPVQFLTRLTMFIEIVNINLFCLLNLSKCIFFFLYHMCRMMNMRVLRTAFHLSLKEKMVKVKMEKRQKPVMMMIMMTLRNTTWIIMMKKVQNYVSCMTGMEKKLYWKKDVMISIFWSWTQSNLKSAWTVCLYYHCTRWLSGNDCTT